MDTNKDHWIREDSRKCEFCTYYQAKCGPIGRCRRNAPTLDGWPVVRTDDWCGEIRLIKLNSNDVN